jgi:uncharacterized protein YcbK (DUF882 family)
MRGPSDHLTWSELMSHDGVPYPPQWRQDRAVTLAAAFEAIRARWNLEIGVTSGYRSPRWNAHVGGASESQHVQGRALDLVPPEGVSVFEFWNYILTIAEAVGIRGVGYAAPSKGGFVHVDTRESPVVVQWRY